MTDSKDSREGQISESSMATPEGGADGVPGTEEGTPSAADSQHSRPGGMKDYGGAPAETD